MYYSRVKNNKTQAAVFCYLKEEEEENSHIWFQKVA